MVVVLRTENNSVGTAEFGAAGAGNFEADTAEVDNRTAGSWVDIVAVDTVVVGTEVEVEIVGDY